MGNYHVALAALPLRLTTASMDAWAVGRWSQRAACAPRQPPLPALARAAAINAVCALSRTSGIRLSSRPDR